MVRFVIFCLAYLWAHSITAQVNKTVVLTFDDACASDYHFVAPLLKKYGFGATFYVCEFPDVYPDSTKALNWRQVREIAKMGFEIGNHTQHHKGVYGLKEAELVAELQYVEDKIDSLGLPKMSSFCYPFYGTDSLAIRVLKERGYSNARTGGDQPFDPRKHSPFLIPSWTISKNNPQTFYDALKDEREGVIVFCFHGVPDIAHDGVSTDPKVFKEYMDYLRKNNYRVISMRDLFK